MKYDVSILVRKSGSDVDFHTNLTRPAVRRWLVKRGFVKRDKAGQFLNRRGNHVAVIWSRPGNKNVSAEFV